MSKKVTYAVDVSSRHFGSDVKGEYVYIAAVNEQDLKSRILDKLDGILADKTASRVEIQINFVKG